MRERSPEDVAEAGPEAGTDAGPEPRLYGVLVTYRRPTELEATLTAIAGQRANLEHLVVVDNAPDPRTPRLVAACVGAEYVAAPENLGPAGGIALGMERLLERATDHDWIVTLDDDDPPQDPAVFADLLAFAIEVSERDGSTAAVGLSGVRFDRHRGRVVRVPDDELVGAVNVDAIAGNACPCYSVRALRAVGTMRADLFFGHEELELGLRLRDAAFSLYGHGARWRAARTASGRLGIEWRPSRSLGEADWRRFYSLRNVVRILRERGTRGSALRVTLVVGLAKPIVNAVREPRRAFTHLLLSVRACRDGWVGRMGRTLEPPT